MFFDLLLVRLLSGSLSVMCGHLPLSAETPPPHTIAWVPFKCLLRADVTPCLLPSPQSPLTPFNRGYVLWSLILKESENPKLWWISLLDYLQEGPKYFLSPSYSCFLEQWNFSLIILILPNYTDMWYRTSLQPLYQKNYRNYHLTLNISGT